jgi:type 1 glutamine amidotransferase
MTPLPRRRFLLLSGLAIAALIGPASVSHAKPKKPVRLLIVNDTEGFHHSSTALGADIITKLGQDSGLWTTDKATTPDEVKAKVTADNLKNVDVVVFENSTGELPISDENKKALIDWIRAGHGFAGMHSATDTFYQWPEYGPLIGGHFNGHPWHQLVTLKVEDPKFPGLQGFVQNPQITDEIYQFKEWSRGDKHVLMSIDPGSIDVSKGAREDKDYAVSWVKMEGKGRVFYTSLGHREEVWNDPRYQQHILAGIKWVAGLDKTRVKLPKSPAGK